MVRNKEKGKRKRHPAKACAFARCRYTVSLTRE